MAGGKVLTERSKTLRPAHLSGAGLRPLAEVGGDRGQALHRRVPVSHGLRLHSKQRAAVLRADVLGHVEAFKHAN